MGDGDGEAQAAAAVTRSRNQFALRHVLTRQNTETEPLFSSFYSSYE